MQASNLQSWQHGLTQSIAQPHHAVPNGLMGYAQSRPVFSTPHQTSPDDHVSVKTEPCEAMPMETSNSQWQ